MPSSTKNCDIIKAYKNAKACQSTISSQHNEGKFSELWKKAEIIATEVGTQLTKPRTPHISTYRSGSDSTDAESLQAECILPVY